MKRRLATIAIIAAPILGLAAPAHAEAIKVISKDKLKAGCSAAGGVFSANKAGYSCTSYHTDGSYDAVHCIKSKCQHIHVPA